MFSCSSENQAFPTLTHHTPSLDVAVRRSQFPCSQTIPARLRHSPYINHLIPTQYQHQNNPNTYLLMYRVNVNPCCDRE
nr:unnamed protein product [Callosobruchus analis]